VPKGEPAGTDSGATYATSFGGPPTR
jgi:hypothetical protein